jgi:hypothetical protein
LSGHCALLVRSHAVEVAICDRKNGAVVTQVASLPNQNMKLRAACELRLPGLMSGEVAV